MPKYLSVWFCGLITLCLFTACQQKEVSNTSSGNASEANTTLTVEVVKPSMQSFNAVTTISGTANPNQKASIHAMESGMVRSIKKDIGDKVNRGTVLAILDNPEVDAALAEAEAEYDIAKAELEMIRADQVASKANIDIKERLFNRLNKIKIETPQLLPVAELERAQGELEIAKANQNAMAAKLNAKNKRIAALEKMKNYALQRKGMLNIKAPFSGIVTNRNVDVGDIAQSGISNSSSRALFEIQDLDPIRLTIPVPGADATNIKKGDELTLNFPELIGTDIQAKVSRTSGALDPMSKTMQVEIDVPNDKSEILSGMYAKVKIQSQSRSGVLSLPLSAIKMHNDIPHILLVENETVKYLAIRKGLSGKEYFEILNAELSKDALVIIQGKGLVKNGDKVKAILKN